MSTFQPLIPYIHECCLFFPTKVMFLYFVNSKVLYQLLTIFPSLKDKDFTHVMFSKWVLRSARIGLIWGKRSAACLKNQIFMHSKINTFT